MASIILRIVGAAALVFFLVFDYACCVVAGRADHELEELEWEHLAEEAAKKNSNN